VRAVKVIVEEEARKISSSMITGLIGMSIGPLSCNGLNEALGLIVGLRPVEFGKEVSDPELGRRQRSRVSGRRRRDR
jgi:hypothetical protein